jgi:hypothetical protein
MDAVHKSLCVLSIVALSLAVLNFAGLVAVAVILL